MNHPTKQTQSTQSEGAELVYDTQGAGDALLCIPGAGGNASAYTEMAALLADRYRVITYDRRCNGRSSGDPAKDLDMAQQARDVVAVLRAAGHERAFIFGNSGGANIALKVAADFPEQVTLLVAHEPPTIKLLPASESAQMIRFTEATHAAFQKEGVPAAMRSFAGGLVGIDFRAGRPGGLGEGKDLAFFFAREYLNITFFEPDLNAIRNAKVPTLLLHGALSEDAFYVRTGRIIAEKLGCPFISVPGNHLAFKLEPPAFARALSELIADFTPSSERA